MATVLDWQMAVYHRLKDGMPQTPVYLEGVAEGTPLPRDPTGMPKPVAMIWFGQLTELTVFGRSAQGLAGTEGGIGLSKNSHFLVNMVAPTGLSLIQMESVVRSLLTGFRPVGEGEIWESGAGSIRDPLPTGIGETMRFYKPMYFTGVLTVDAVRIDP